MRLAISILLVLFVLLMASYAEAGLRNHNERWYQEKYCDGVTEYRLLDGTRVDCLSDNYAIEFDWGKKWAECIGQAQYYSRQTGKWAGCVLIKPHERYLKRVLRAFDGAVWVADDNKIERIR